MNSTLPTIIFMDRDGTLIEDNDYYIWSDPNWKEKIIFRKWVAEGFNLLKNCPEVLLVIVTNQSGCARAPWEPWYISEYSIKEVNTYIEDMCFKIWKSINLTLWSPYISQKQYDRYIKQWIKINTQYIDTSGTLSKPGVSMGEEALKFLWLEKWSVKMFMIGDRLSDMEFGLSLWADVCYLTPSSKTETTLPQKKKIKHVTDFWIAIESIITILESHKL